MTKAIICGKILRIDGNRKQEGRSSAGQSTAPHLGRPVPIRLVNVLESLSPLELAVEKRVRRCKKKERRDAQST